MASIDMDIFIARNNLNERLSGLPLTEEMIWDEMKRNGGKK